MVVAAGRPWMVWGVPSAPEPEYPDLRFGTCEGTTSVLVDGDTAPITAFGNQPKGSRVAVLFQPGVTPVVVSTSQRGDAVWTSVPISSAVQLTSWFTDNGGSKAYTNGARFLLNLQVSLANPLGAGTPFQLATVQPPYLPLGFAFGGSVATAYNSIVGQVQEDGSVNCSSALPLAANTNVNFWVEYPLYAPTAGSVS